MRRLQSRFLLAMIYAAFFLFLYIFMCQYTISGLAGERERREDERGGGVAGEEREKEDRAFGTSWLDHLCPRKLSNLKLLAKVDHLRVLWEPHAEGSIFFTQMSCDVELTSSEACVVESASLHHPHQQVVLYTTSPFINKNNPLLRVVLGLDNVKAVWLDLDQVFEKEPLYSWHQNRYWLLNPAVASTAINEAVRVELLHRWGGTYLDLDMVTLRPLPSHANWIGRLDHKQISNAVANFTKNHKLFEMAVAAIPKAFDPNDCCSLGPLLLTKCLHEICPDNFTIPDSADPDTMEVCDNITIYNTHAFYPTYSNLWRIFTSNIRSDPNFYADNQAYTLHLSHSLTDTISTAANSDSILAKTARRNCPKVHEAIIKNNLLL